jgi:hypothetical protein
VRGRYLILLLIFFVAGCVTTSKIRIPRKAINKVEVENNKAEIIKPEIKRPQIRRPEIKWRNKKMDTEATNNEGENNKAEINELAETAQSHKIISEAERAKRFDNLLAESPEIKEEKESLFDRIFVWIGALGVCAVFWTGVYFVAKNLK